MATQKQIEANRRNAQKSTGPITPEGKAAVRFNSLRHGLRARAVVLPGENAADFHQLCDGFEAEWQPRTPTEEVYVEQMAIAQWKLARLEVAEAGVSAQNLPAQIQFNLLDRIWQNQRRLERSFTKAQHELQQLQKARRQAEAKAAPDARPAAPTAPSEPRPAGPAEYFMSAGATPQRPAGRPFPHPSRPVSEPQS
jgi:hypothetical protein